MLTKYLKLFTVFALIVLVYFLITSTISYTLPLVIAIIIAICMEPGVSFLIKNLKFPRPLASIAILLGFIFSLITLSVLTLTELYEGITYLAERLPNQLKTFGEILDHYLHSVIIPIYEDILILFNQLDASEQMMIQQYMTDLFNQIANFIGSFFQELLFSIPDLITKLPQFLTLFVFIFLASIIISADFPNMKKMATSLTPKKLHQLRDNLSHYFKKAMTGYVKAQVILVSISFFIILSGLFILKVDHALTIGFFMLLIDLIPYLGTGLLFIPWIFYTFLTGNYALTIGLAIIYAIVIITRQLIEPKVLSMSMGIHPLAWLIAVFLGFKIWGVVGLLFAPFILVFIKSMQQAGVFHAVYRYIMK
ncbi:sporulation integral membrane protein YtvI [Oceanobacillus sp. CAU 1775]